MTTPDRHREARRSTDIEAELDEELRFHLDMRREEYEASGATPDEAGRRALRKFGDVSFIRAEALTIGQRLNRRAARAETMSALLQDVRYALRTIRLTPGAPPFLRSGRSACHIALVEPTAPGVTRRLESNQVVAGLGPGRAVNLLDDLARGPLRRVARPLIPARHLVRRTK